MHAENETRIKVDDSLQMFGQHWSLTCLKIKNWKNEVRKRSSEKLHLTYSPILIVDTYFQTFTHPIKCGVLFYCCIVTYLCVCHSFILSLPPSALLPRLSYEAEFSLSVVIIHFIVVESAYKP